MAMGRHKPRQGDLMMSWAALPRSPGNAFHDRLKDVLIGGGFDAFAEDACHPFYATTMGAPSVPPGRYFRMHLIGYFEGIDSDPLFKRVQTADRRQNERVFRSAVERGQIRSENHP